MSWTFGQDQTATPYWRSVVYQSPALGQTAAGVYELTSVYTGTSLETLRAIQATATLAGANADLQTVCAIQANAIQGDYGSAGNAAELVGVLGRTDFGGRSTVDVLAGVHGQLYGRDQQASDLSAGIIGEINADYLGADVAAGVTSMMAIKSNSAPTVAAWFYAMPWAGDALPTTVLYGLYIPNIGEGAAAGRSIKTNSGAVEFGDNLITTGGLCYGAPLLITAETPDLIYNHDLAYTETEYSFNTHLPLGSTLPLGWTCKVYNNGDRHDTFVTVLKHNSSADTIDGTVAIGVGQMATIIKWSQTGNIGYFTCVVETVYPYES